REVVDLYRTLLMRDRLGDTLEGTVTALVGSGVYVSLDEPFVDVLVRFEGLGPDRYETGADEISLVGARSGDTISLGDRMLVTIEDVAVLRRTVYARRIVPEALLSEFGGERSESGERNERRGRARSGSRGEPPRRSDRGAPRAKVHQTAPGRGPKRDHRF